MNPLIKRVLVGIVGGLVTLVGVVALVAPGPGWLIIFKLFGTNTPFNSPPLPSALLT